MEYEEEYIKIRINKNCNLKKKKHYIRILNEIKSKKT